MENNLDSSSQEVVHSEVVAEKPFPSIKQTWGLIGIFLLAYIIVTILLIIILEFVSTDMKSLMYAIVYALYVGILLFIAILKSKHSKFLWKRVPWQVLLLTVPLVISLAILLEPLVNVIPMPEIIKETFEELFSNDIYSFTTIVIIAPILEEMIFRGIILNNFLKRYSPLKAIIWSSIFFGIAHFNPWQFIGAFGFGLIIGWIYWKSNSLIPCITIHFFNNLFAFLLMMYSGESMITMQQLMGDGKLYYILYGVCIPIFIASLIITSKRLKAKTVINTHPNS